MVATGIVAASRSRVTGMRGIIAIAVAGASLAGCSSFSTDCLQADAAHRPGPARVDSAGRRRQDVAGAGLQDALLGRGARGR